MTNPVLRVGLVGGGLIAKAHATAYTLLPAYYPPPFPQPVKAVLCDVDLPTAEAAARRLGFAGAVGDYRELVTRDDVDIVDITVPNHLHAPIAIAAARAGKMIVSEKPLATDVASAREMVLAAREAGVPTAVNFQKRRTPAVAHAKHLVETGAIGDVLLFHGSYRQHFGLLPLPEGNWRASKEQLGAFLAEVGSHIIDLTRFLVGEFRSVTGITNREATGRTGDLDSIIAWSAVLDRGVVGSFDVCGTASGENDGLGFEVYGTKGAIRWHSRHAQVLEVSLEPPAESERGFKTIRMSAEHPRGEVFAVLTQEGFADVKTFELHDILEAFASGAPYSPSFIDGLRAAEVVEAVLRSAETGARVNLEPSL